MTIPAARLGREGPVVGRLGLGCNRMSIAGVRDDAESIRTIHGAIDGGINLLDTGDFYGMGHNEALIGRAIADRRDDVVLSVKNGAMFSPTGQFLGVDGRPKAVKNFCAYSLQRLGVDVIDLYQPGRPDPDVPYEDTIGAIAELIAEGKVRHLGVSEVGVDHLRRAHAIHRVAALEIEYSIACRFIEADILPVARELGIAIVPYRVLADGMLSGAVGDPMNAAGGSWLPSRLAPEHLSHNLAAIEMVHRMAAAKGITSAQLAVAWLLSQGDDIFPLVGMTRVSRLAENLAIPAIGLTTEELAMIDRDLSPGAIRGDRYPDFVMKYVAR